MCYSLCCTHDVAGHRPATSWVHYTTSCNKQSSAPEGGQNNRPKHVEPTGIINKPLLFASSRFSMLFIFHFIFLRLDEISQFIPLENVVYFITTHFWFVKYSHFK